jgi:hypothetical protein
LGRRVYLVKGFEHDLKVHNNDDVNKVEIKLNYTTEKNEILDVPYDDGIHYARG